MFTEEKHKKFHEKMDIEFTVRYYTALGKISDILTESGMTYSDYCALTLELDKYYHNWADMIDADLDDREFASMAVLPSMNEIDAVYVDTDDDEWDEE